MKKEHMEVVRIDADINEGLTSAEVQRRIKEKQTNRVKKVVGKSYLAIFMSNIFTFFNLLGFIIFILMMLCGSTENMMFCVIIVANTAIGIFQEIRSKLAVEKLALVSEPTVTVVRDGIQQVIPTKEIVLDDILLYVAGKQICTDSVVIIGEVEVNEAMLTGESDSVKKKAGDTLFSGSYIVSGNCTARADKVGRDSYVERLSATVKKSGTPNSELMRSIRGIIKVISFIIFPIGLATFFLSTEMQQLYSTGTAAYIWNSYFSGNAAVIGNVNDAIKQMAGSMIGMVPSGMVLLTSVALAVSALKLARKKVLVRELPCIEMLARVDTLCLDKTGTITDGSMTVDSVIMLDDSVKDLGKLIKGVLNATGDENATAAALNKYYADIDGYESVTAVPFSSARKYSAATLKGRGTVAIGAAEFLFKKSDKNLNAQCVKLLKKGLRVLAVGVSKKPIKNNAADGLVPVAIIALQDTVRSDAPEIIKWFKDNNVAVKVISGDNPVSVSVIADKVGIENADKYISLDGMSDEEVAAAANEYTVFGRVSPEQKAVLVRAMKKAGRTVAMTGDGVNDILAMRESDCAVSVGCGSDAAKTVAHLVLSDSKFSSMPKVVAEGRQVVNNIQNSSSLFLMKTSMTILTSILMLCLPGFSYPFEPQHLYAMEFFVIGISSFLLALKPNRNLIKGRFITNTLKSTLPSGMAMFMSVAMTYAFLPVLNITDSAQISTVAMFSMTVTGVFALWILLYPYGLVNIGIGSLATVGTVGCYFLFPWALGLLNKWAGKGEPNPIYVPIDGNAILFIAINAAAMAVLIIAGKLIMKKIDQTRERKLVAADVSDN